MIIKSSDGDIDNSLFIVIFFRNFFKPLGIALGIKDSKHLKPPTNDILEKEHSLLEKSRDYSSNFKQVSHNNVWNIL